MGSGSPLGPHSYDLGVSRSGLFWTTPVPEGNVRVDFDDGEAVLRLRNICALDTFTTGNSLSSGSMLGHPVAAVIHSLTIRWSGIKRTVTKFQSMPLADDQFSGDFIETAATIEADVTTLPSTGHGFHFVSDPANTTVSNFAQIGKERNGSFALAAT